MFEGESGSMTEAEDRDHDWAPAEPHWRQRIQEEAWEKFRWLGADEALPEVLSLFYQIQLRDWPELARAVENLERLDHRTIRADGREVVLQHNPSRLSSADTPSAEQRRGRPCPLCPQNMPARQEAIPWYGRWMIVHNPAPIFRRHLVLVRAEHIPQRPRGFLGDMARFAAASGYACIYNGPNAGASIPEHMHLQAAPPGQIPLGGQLPEVRPGQILVEPGLPPRVFLRGREIPELEQLYDRTLRALNRTAGQPETSDPELDLAAFPAPGAGTPVVTVVPRAKHRPSCFYRQGPERCVTSPDATDVSGFLVLPRREDYEKMDRGLLEEIYREVCPDRGVHGKAGGGTEAPAPCDALRRLTPG